MCEHENLYRNMVGSVQPMKKGKAIIKHDNDNILNIRKPTKELRDVNESKPEFFMIN